MTMVKSLLTGVGVAAGMAVSVQASPIQTLLNNDGQVPRHMEWEAGVVGTYHETENTDFWTVRDERNTDASAYARWSYDKLTLSAYVPYVQHEIQDGSSEAGLGDITAGVDFRAYEDIFGYPFFQPYFRLTLPTGDDEKGLGAGKTGTAAGIVLADTSLDDYHFSADIGYDFRDGENRFAVGAAVVWDMNKTSSLIGEFRHWAKTDELKEATLFVGGLSTKLTKNWLFVMYAGREISGESDVLVGGRLAYTFD